MPSRSERSRPARLGSLALPPGDERRHQDVLEGGHPFEKVEELEDDSDVLAAHHCKFALGLADERLTGNPDLAFVGHVETGDDVEQCRLATSRWTHHGDEFAATDVEVGPAQRTNRSSVLFERAEHLTDVDDEVLGHGLGLERFLADRHDAVSWRPTAIAAGWLMDEIFRGRTGVLLPFTR